jgi:hypothetical protein
MRLYAKENEIEKYGADAVLIQNLPLILEEKRDEEKINSVAS